MNLPPIIPLLTDTWNAEKPYPFEWVAVGINLIYKNRWLKINILNQLHKRLKIPEKTNIILINHGYDCYIEDYWCYAHGKGYIEALANSNIKLATGFNYSLFDIHSRMSHLISLKKSLITTIELLDAGLNTIPHIYFKTKKDIERWINFLKQNDINMASANLTFKKSQRDFINTVNDISLFTHHAGKEIQWLVVGVSTFNKVKYITKKLGNINIVCARPICLARSRRIFTHQGIKHIPELTQYEAFIHNYHFLKKAWKKGIEIRRKIATA